MNDNIDDKDLKEIDNIEDTSKQTKAWHPVQYQHVDRQFVGDANQQLNSGSTMAKIERTMSSTSNLPISSNSQGIIIGVQSEPARQTGYQIFVNKSGEMATRYIDEDNSRNNSGWKGLVNKNNVEDIVNNKTYDKAEIERRINAVNVSDDYFKKPEKASHVADIDLLLDSSIRKTNSNSQGTFPNSINNKDGIIQTFSLDGGIGSPCYQLLILTGGNGRGKMYTRVYDRISRWSSWIIFDPSQSNSVGSLDNYYTKTQTDGNYMKQPKGDINDFNNVDEFKSKGSGFFRFGTHTNNRPSGVDFGTVLSTLQNTSNGTGNQVLFVTTGTKSGKILSRSWNAGQKTEWVELSTDTSSFFKNPTTVTQNLESISTPGYYRTDNNSVGLPTQVTGNNKHGIGVYVDFLQGSSSRFGNLTWYSISGDDNPIVYTRKRINGTWKPWKKVLLEDDIQQSQGGSFEHHSVIPSNDIKQITQSGYYFTNEQTLNLPDKVKGTSKKGILKVLVKDHQNKIFEYTVGEGKDAGHIFAGVLSNTITRDADRIHWDKVSSTDGHTKIHDTRSSGQITPHEYYEHTNWDTGYLMYEWKWASDVGIHTGDFVPPITANKDLVLQTIIPDEAKIQAGESVISQMAYVIADNRQFWRKSEDSQGHRWTKWEETTTDKVIDRKLDKPEYIQPIGDASNLTHSGIFRTGSSSTNLPSQVTNKTGILQSYIDDAQNQIQYWTPTNQTGYKGSFWTRVKSAGGWENWTQLGTGGSGPSPSLNDYIQIPESQQEISDLNSISKTSFRKASGNTTGAPPFSKNPSKKGVVQSIVNGNNKVQIWFSTDDSDTGQIFYRYKQSNKGDWSRWGLLNKQIAMPEYENQVDNLNELKYSGVFRTTNSSQSQSHKDSFPIPVRDARDGLVEYYKFNNSPDNYKGVQVFHSLQGSTVGKIYKRYNLTGNNNAWNPWEEVGGSSTPSQVTEEQILNVIKKMFEEWKKEHPPVQQP